MKHQLTRIFKAPLTETVHIPTIMAVDGSIADARTGGEIRENGSAEVGIRKDNKVHIFESERLKMVFFRILLTQVHPVRLHSASTQLRSRRNRK